MQIHEAVYIFNFYKYFVWRGDKWILQLLSELLGQFL